MKLDEHEKALGFVLANRQPTSGYRKARLSCGWGTRTRTAPLANLATSAASFKNMRQINCAEINLLPNRADFAIFQAPFFTPKL